MVILLLLLLLLPSAARAAEVAGKVTDAAGSPVAGAEITVAWDSLPQPPVLLLRSDPQGRFAVPRRAPGARVAAHAPGHGLACAWLSRSAPEIALRLPPSHTACGRLLAPDGSPAAGVAVRLAALPISSQLWAAGFRRYSLFSWQRAPEPLAERFTARTDETGAFRISGLSPAGARLTVADPRFAGDVFPGDDCGREIRLRAGCRIRGQLRAGDGVLDGWSVTALPSDGTGEPATAATGKDGGFLLSGLAPGEYYVRATGPPETRFVVGIAEVKLDEPGSEAEVALRAVRGCVVAGRVVESAGKAPLADVGIVVDARPPGGPLYCEYAVSCPDGRFGVLMPPGACRAHPGTAPRGSTVADVGVAFVAREGQENRVEVPLQVGPALTGRVRDAQGRPAAGVWVAGRNVDALACTGADGSFHLPRVPVKGVISLGARRGDEGTAMPADLKPPFPANVELAIGPLPQVALVGRVVDEWGRPVPNLPVLLTRHDLSEGTAGRAHAMSTTDTTGHYRFVIHDLTGEYRVEDDSDLRRLLASGHSLGDPGPQRRMSEVVVTAADVTVSGRVLDAAGRPAAGARVFWALGTSRHRAVTDAQGRFRIAGVPGHPIALVARDEKRGGAVVRAVPGQDALIFLGE